MNPWKNLAAVSSWLMRIAVVLVIYTRWFGVLLQLSFETLVFWYSAAYVVAAFLLLAGGFFKQSLTVIAGLMIFILSVLQIIQGFNGITPMMAQWVLLAAAGLYFTTNGNK